MITTEKELTPGLPGTPAPKLAEIRVYYLKGEDVDTSVELSQDGETWAEHANIHIRFATHEAHQSGFNVTLSRVGVPRVRLYEPGQPVLSYGWCLAGEVEEFAKRLRDAMIASIEKTIEIAQSDLDQIKLGHCSP